ncbi:MAG: phosphoribosylanthranilate isomerase [Lachnospiraceae bacterium]|nr:phosphoribosylanthranilate isomerase [Lachnospiraceae bacterium]
MIKTKICGITKLVEAEYLNEFLPEYVGFVLFFPKSKRNISLKQAQEIIRELDSSIKKVAVTVSLNLSQLKQIEEAGFDYLQVHGTLFHEVYEQAQIPLIRAVQADEIWNGAEYREKDKIKGFVFDAKEPGSGKVFDWEQLNQLEKPAGELFLAGGLTPDNVAKAIEIVHPDVVDVSSGVEGTDGKDREKIKQFIRQVKMKNRMVQNEE